MDQLGLSIGFVEYCLESLMLRKGLGKAEIMKLAMEVEDETALVLVL